MTIPTSRNIQQPDEFSWMSSRLVKLGIKHEAMLKYNKLTE